MTEERISSNDPLLEHKELYVDAICSFAPPPEQWPELTRLGVGYPEPINLLPGASEHWLWSVSGLRSLTAEALRRLHLGLKPVQLAGTINVERSE